MMLRIGEPIIRFNPGEIMFQSILNDGVLTSHIYESYIDAILTGVSMGPDQPQFSNTRNYYEYRCLETSLISKQAYGLTSRQIGEFLISALADEFYILLRVQMSAIDEYCVMDHKASHSLFIYGYDIATDVFYIADFFNGVYSHKMIRQCKITNAFDGYDSSASPMDILLTRKRHGFDSAFSIQIMYDKMVALMSTYECYCSVRGYNVFRKILASVVERFNEKERVHIKSVAFISAHITMMDARIRELEKTHQAFMLFRSDLDQLCAEAAILTNMCMKYNVACDNSVAVRIKPIMTNIIEDYACVIFRIIQCMLDNCDLGMSYPFGTQI